MGFSEFCPRLGPGAYECGDIAPEGSNGSRFGRARFAAFGKTRLGDAAEQFLPGLKCVAPHRRAEAPTQEQLAGSAEGLGSGAKWSSGMAF